jgi:phosphoadenosine phosphosulfate reductase
MNLTSVDPPELVRFVREKYPEVDMVKPRKSMHRMIIEKGFPPTGQIRYCCADLKEHSGKGRFIVNGVRREESSSRAKYEHVQNDTRKTGKTFMRPILTWTEADVWEYIEIHNLPYPSLYDEGFSRLGCVMCPMAGSKQMEIEAKRWPAIYKMYMGAFDKAIKRNKERGKKCTQETAQEMMDWWMQKK